MCLVDPPAEAGPHALCPCGKRDGVVHTSSSLAGSAFSSAPHAGFQPAGSAYAGTIPQTGGILGVKSKATRR
jgi:hypothetical protein